MYATFSQKINEHNPTKQNNKTTHHPDTWCINFFPACLSRRILSDSNKNSHVHENENLQRSPNGITEKRKLRKCGDRREVPQYSLGGAFYQLRVKNSNTINICLWLFLPSIINQYLRTLTRNSIYHKNTWPNSFMQTRESWFYLNRW